MAAWLRLLVNDKTPLIVTVFVAVLSWTALRTNDRLTSTPFIEYRLAERQNEAGIPSVELRLRNLTTASKFDCFVLTLVPRHAEPLKFGESSKVEYRLHGTALVLPTVSAATADEWNINIHGLAPGADLSIFIPTIGSGIPAVLADPCPGATAANTDKQVLEPILIELSWRTYFVEYELQILWTLLLFWLSGIMYILTLAGDKPPAAQKMEEKQNAQA